MTSKIPDWLKFPMVLFVVAVVSAASLAGLWALTTPVKRAIEGRITEDALKVVFPSATSFVEKSAAINGHTFVYREAMDGDELAGYVAEGMGTGYSSILKVMVGVDADFVVQGIKVLSQKETPGLGDKVEEIISKKTWGTVLFGTNPDETDLRPWFQQQFDGQQAPVDVQKDGGQIEAITGATISSRAVCKAVNQAVEELKTAVGSDE